MNDVQRQIYINKHTGEMACKTLRRQIIQLGKGEICDRFSPCSNRAFCNGICWQNTMSRASKYTRHCSEFLRRQHTLTLSQRHAFALSLVGKSVATTYTKVPTTIESARICPEVENCGYNSYCKGIIVTLRKGKRKPLYEIKCELDLRYFEGE